MALAARAACLRCRWCSLLRVAIIRLLSHVSGIQEASTGSLHTNGDAVLRSASGSIVREASFQSKVTPTAVRRTAAEDDDVFAAQLERQLRTEERMRTEKAHEPQFKIQDLIRNPDLAAAAWQEMAGANEPEEEEPKPSTAVALAAAPTGGIAGLLVPSPGKPSAHTTPRGRDRMGRGAVALMRDRGVLESMQADADAEFKINTDISRLLISRLKAGRMALENLSEFVLVCPSPPLLCPRTHLDNNPPLPHVTCAGPARTQQPRACRHCPTRRAPPPRS